MVLYDIMVDKDVIRTDQSVEFFKTGEIDNSRPLNTIIEEYPNLVKLRSVLMTLTIFNFELGNFIV